MGTYDDRFFRDDILGLRGLSAVLIMIYHVWLNKVSGGVDVFFLVSGFLITTHLLREFETTGRVSIVAFWARISARIFPAAIFVLICTALLTLVLVPPPLWKFGVNELIASALQVENWELFRTSTLYLNRDDPPSQFQQFWALSVQVQFYILIPLACAALSPLIRRRRSFAPLLVFFVLAATASLAWSIDFTAASPARAFFSTFTRLWEFFLGSILALAYPHIVHRAREHRLGSPLYAGALVVFILFGLVTPSTVAFPGAIALVPVTCGVILIVAGAVLDRSNRVYATLGSAPMAALGRIAFTTYLWHWPLLIFAQHQLQTTHIGLLSGLSVMAIALGLAWATHRFIEAPWRVRLRSAPTIRSLTTCGLAVLAVAGAGMAARQTMIWGAKRDQVADVPSLRGGPILPGMVAQRPDLRTFILSNYDRPTALDGCRNGERCVFGDANAEFTVALVGGSHSAQWQPVLDYAGRRHGFRVITVLASGQTTRLPDGIDPDVVVTTATRTGFTHLGEKTAAPQEQADEGQIALFKDLEARGVPIIAIRDNPRFAQYQNGCVWRNPDAHERCSLNRASVFLDINPAMPLAQEIGGLHLVDLSDLLCTETTCPAIVNGIMIYYDRHHISHSYMRHIAEAATTEILRQAPGLLPTAQ